VLFFFFYYVGFVSLGWVSCGCLFIMGCGIWVPWLGFGLCFLFGALVFCVWGSGAFYFWLCGYLWYLCLGCSFFFDFFFFFKRGPGIASGSPRPKLCAPP